MRAMFMVLAACVALTASTAMAGVSFVEDYDSQIVNQPPGAPWYDIFVGGVWVEDAGKQNSKPYSLLINNAGFGGVDKGSSAPLDGGAVWNGSDDCPLVLSYWVRHGSGRQERDTDYYVELSLGDVHAPPAPDDEGNQTIYDPPLPVMAWCKPWNSGDADKKLTWYFDGSKWDIVGSSVNETIMTMSVATDTADISRTGVGYTVDRAYKGGFDTISIYTINFRKGGYTSIDDVSVTGGYTAIPAALDILPNDDPNNFVPNKKSKGRLPMAILGSADLDVSAIDADSILVEDVIAPVKAPDLQDVNGDGYLDLVILIARRDLIDALGLDLLDPDTVVDVTVSGKIGCDDVIATDSIVIKPLGD